MLIASLPLSLQQALKLVADELPAVINTHEYKLGLLACSNISNRTLLTRRHATLNCAVLRYSDSSKYKPALLHQLFIWLQRRRNSIRNCSRDATFPTSMTP